MANCTIPLSVIIISFDLIVVKGNCAKTSKKSTNTLSMIVADDTNRIVGSRNTNNRINKLYERAFRLENYDFTSTSEEFAGERQIVQCSPL